MRIFNYLSLFILAAFITACASQVTTARPTQSDLSAYSTFAYLPNADISMPDTELDQEAVNQRIVETVKTQMQGEGYQLDRDNPDLLVLISVKRSQETGVERDAVYATYPYRTYNVNTVSPYYSNYYYNGFYDYGTVAGYDTDTYQYTEGTLIISLVDRETRNTVWKGMTSEAIYSGSTTDEIVQLVDDIFDEYPINRRAR